MKILKTKADYSKALKRMMSIFDATEGTLQAKELGLLLKVIKKYEDKHFHIPTNAWSVVARLRKRASSNPPSLASITKEVEKVRAKRYAQRGY